MLKLTKHGILYDIDATPYSTVIRDVFHRPEQFRLRIRELILTTGIPSESVDEVTTDVYKEITKGIVLSLHRAIFNSEHKSLRKIFKEIKHNDDDI